MDQATLVAAAAGQPHLAHPLRRIAVGRNNWLFAGSDAGGERAAVIYTVLGTCRLRGIDPCAWLRDILEKLASGWKQARIAELLPAEPDAAAAA